MDTPMKVIIGLDHSDCSHAAFNCKFVYCLEDNLFDTYAV